MAGYTCNRAVGGDHRGLYSCDDPRSCFLAEQSSLPPHVDRHVYFQNMSRYLNLLFYSNDFFRAGRTTLFLYFDRPIVTHACDGFWQSGARPRLVRFLVDHAAPLSKLNGDNRELAII